MNFEGNEFRRNLYNKMNKLVHLVYGVSRSFPKEEMYGVTSQLRRATMSIVLNYIEGYSRFRKKTVLLFLEISFGSMKESTYLIDFCKEEKYLSLDDFENINGLINEVGAMLWKEMMFCRDKIKNKNI
ncbi:MAG: four helix bundle protein [Patescibacteria group bacterium]